MDCCDSCRFIARMACSHFVAKSYTIKGDSMDPTLKDGQHVMVNILGYKVGNIKKEMLLSSMLINLITMLKE